MRDNKKASQHFKWQSYKLVIYITKKDIWKSNKVIHTAQHGDLHISSHFLVQSQWQWKIQGTRELSLGP